MARRKLVWLLWLMAYLACAAVLVVGLSRARRQVIATLSQTESLAQWQEWKTETHRQSEASPAGPARRKPVTSDEPPALVLMRDYFAAIVGVALLAMSVLFGFVWFVAGNAAPSGGGVAKR